MTPLLCACGIQRWQGPKTSNRLSKRLFFGITRTLAGMRIVPRREKAWFRTNPVTIMMAKVAIRCFTKGSLSLTRVFDPRFLHISSPYHPLADLIESSQQALRTAFFPCDSKILHDRNFPYLYTPPAPRPSSSTLRLFLLSLQLFSTAV